MEFIFEITDIKTDCTPGLDGGIEVKKKGKGPKQKKERAPLELLFKEHGRWFDKGQKRGLLQIRQWLLAVIGSLVRWHLQIGWSR
jgi:hypothetical protein